MLVRIKPAEATAQHLTHAGKIVRFALRALAANFEALVGAFLGHALGKDHHGADRIATLQRRYVECFDT